MLPTHSAAVMDMPPAVAGAVLSQLPRLAAAVHRGMDCEGVNILQNNGAVAGQEVATHMYVHEWHSHHWWYHERVMRVRILTGDARALSCDPGI